MNVYGRVSYGVELLDRTQHEWWKSINLNDFDIAFGQKCVLGQIFGGYGKGLDSLNLTQQVAVQHGFDVTDDDGDGWTNATQMLNDEWKRIITLRQAPKPAPLAEWERDLLMGTPEMVATATFVRTDGQTVVLSSVRVDSIGPSAEHPGVIGVEFENDADRIVHIPFVSHWEISYA